MSKVSYTHVVFSDLCRLMSVDSKEMDRKEQQFTQMILENKSTIYMVCYMFSKDKDEVNDLFQDILVKLWKGYDSFRKESDIRTWIYRVSLNNCLDHQAKKKRRGEQVPLSAGIDIADGMDDKAMQTKQLYSRISNLGLVDRGIILLWLEGLSYDEIASIVGTTAGNISVRLMRIKEHLKQMSNK